MVPLNERLTATQDEINRSVFPPRFAEARRLVRGGVRQATEVGIGDATLAAVLSARLCPVWSISTAPPGLRPC